MEKVLHRAASRGYFDHGWLQTYHTFSFADYYNPSRMHFGALRVLNDDTVAAGEGFDTHPHNDMEIVSIPLEGTLRHRDSLGHESLLHPGQIQVMTAGTGIMHSEFNASADRPVRFLQIWIYPDRQGLMPRYKDIDLMPYGRNRLQPLVVPEGEGGPHVGWLHQQTWFYRLPLDAGAEVAYRLHGASHGLYLFVLDGRVNTSGEALYRRDGLGVWRTDEVRLAAPEAAELLLVEVSM